MAATPMKYRSLTKNDLKRVRKQFREGHQRRMWHNHPLSGAVWGEVCKDLDEVAEIGFTGSRRREAMTLLEQAISRLYEERYSPIYEVAYSARYIYGWLMERLAPYGLEDQRDEHEQKVDAFAVESITALTSVEWADTPTATLRRALGVVSKEPRSLTASDLIFLKTFKLNPYGDANPERLRAVALEIEAIDRVIVTYAALSLDVKLLLGSPEELRRRKEELIEGPVSSTYGGRHLTGWHKSYRQRYEQARELIAEEVELRDALERSKLLLATESRKRQA